MHSDCKGMFSLDGYERELYITWHRKAIRRRRKVWLRSTRKEFLVRLRDWGQVSSNASQSSRKADTSLISEFCRRWLLLRLSNLEETYINGIELFRTNEILKLL